MFSASLKKQFPIFANNPNLVYLDSAASTQKPSIVIKEVSDFFKHDYSNIHRGVCKLGVHATKKYEASREKVAEFLGVRTSAEIIFTKNATEAINLVASASLGNLLQAGDEIVVTQMEHHANLVPWLILEQNFGLVIQQAGFNYQGELNIDKLLQKVNSKTRMLAITHVSNVLGTINPIKEIISRVKQKNNKTLVLVDASQSVNQIVVNVLDLDCDFLVFTGHKLFGPTGIGVLYGKNNLLEQMQPYQSGGDMVKSVSFTKVEYADLPYKFEAGTPNVASVIGLNKAIDFVTNLGLDNIFCHEQELLQYATTQIAEIEELEILGQAKNKAAIITMRTLKPELHCYDLATLLGEQNICMRDGHHCAMPLLEQYNTNSTLRASISIYNDKQDINKMISAIKQNIMLLK